MKLTDIEWTDLSSNPLKFRDKSGKVVWACVKVSSGCRSCYAEAIALRFDRGKVFNAANMEELTPFVCEDEIHHILTAKRIGGEPVDGKKCFLGDMTDIFGEWVSDELLDKIFAAMALRPDVTFQILTKRPERMADYNLAIKPSRIHRIADDMARETGQKVNDHGGFMTWPGTGGGGWPLPNVWLGTSVENQSTADERIPHLLKVPAAVRFLSCEPFLGPVDLRDCRYVDPDKPAWSSAALNATLLGGQKVHLIDWVIVGSESGRSRRKMELGWAESVVDQCRSARVSIFMKQMEIEGSVTGDISYFPKSLQVREYPNANQ